MNKSTYGGYSSSMQGAARHTLTRRRTLKKKHVLLRQYGFYCLVFSSFAYGVHFINRRLNPPEFQSTE